MTMHFYQQQTNSQQSTQTVWVGQPCRTLPFPLHGLSLSLSILTDIFLGEPGLASLLKLRMMEVVVTTGAKIVQSSSHFITTNKPTSNVLQAGCPSCRPTNSVKALPFPSYELLCQIWSFYIKRFQHRWGSKNSPSAAPPHRCFPKCSKPKN